MSNVNLYFFFFKDTATPEIYTLSLHDALPIFAGVLGEEECLLHRRVAPADDSYLLLLEEESVARSAAAHPPAHQAPLRSEEHTSELQSRQYLVCRLLLEKKNKCSIIPHLLIYN